MVEQNSLAGLVDHLRRILSIDFLDNGQLMNSVSLVYLAQGQILFSQGEEAKFCFLVISGSLKIVMQNNGAETILTIISKGELGGALLMGGPSAKYPGSVTALTPATILLIPRGTFIEHWMTHPKAAEFTNACVRKRMRHLQEDKFLQLKSVEGRVINFLHRHYIEKCDLIAKKITRKEIAMAVGAKTETIIRVLKKLEHAGVIKTEKSIISIIDRSYIKSSL